MDRQRRASVDLSSAICGKQVFLLPKSDWINWWPEKPWSVIRGPTVIKKYVFLAGRVSSQNVLDKNRMDMAEHNSHAYFDFVLTNIWLMSVVGCLQVVSEMASAAGLGCKVDPTLASALRNQKNGII